MESFVVKQPRSGLASNPILGTENAKNMINEAFGLVNQFQEFKSRRHAVVFFYTQI